jgi:hypothetical protein
MSIFSLEIKPESRGGATPNLGGTEPTERRQAEGI